MAEAECLRCRGEQLPVARIVPGLLRETRNIGVELGHVDVPSAADGLEPVHIILQPLISILTYTR